MFLPVLVFFVPFRKAIFSTEIPLALTGDPMACITDGAVPGHVINTYCWITHTFTLPHQQGKPVGSHVAHPGVGDFVQGEDETRYHSYYQWVPFMLFFQVPQFIMVTFFFLEANVFKLGSHTFHWLCIWFEGSESCTSNNLFINYINKIKTCF